MGYDLTSLADRDVCFRFGVTGWAQVQALGRLYGWTPAGTEPPAHGWVYCDCDADPSACPDGCHEEVAATRERNRRGWEGGYHANDYQVVTAEDAGAWADGLERALPDLPDHEAFGSGREHLHADAEAVGQLMERLGHPPDAGEAILVSVRALAEAGKLDLAPPFARSWWDAVGRHDPDADATIPDPTLTPIQFFSGAAKRKIRDFIAFCRLGGFWIG